MPTRNRILSRMDKGTLSALGPDLTAVHLQAGTTLWRQESSIRKLYFPVGAVVSLLAGTEGSREVELVTVGNEGLIGLQALIDVPRAVGRALVQVSGEAFVTSSGPSQSLRYLDAPLRCGVGPAKRLC